MEEEKNKKNDPPEINIYQLINTLFIKISSIESQLNYIKSDVKFLKRLIITILTILSAILFKILA
ncbi:MAG: hypothetical protein LM587_02610 [Candidatus Aenigmarchaeota archaeon]|nr:hypothetical protein [Candidatus Aenigmarchaeota archaeon]